MYEVKQSPGSFYIGESPEQALAHIDISIQQGALTIVHTEVTETLKGQGIGQLLVKYVVDYCRQNNLKVIVQCSFARRLFEKNPDYQVVMNNEVELNLAFKELENNTFIKK